MAAVNTGTAIGRRALARLEQDELLWLTTVDPEAVPHPSLIWFHWDGETILIYSQPGAPKVRNIAIHPLVSLNFQANDDGEDVVVIYGDARLDPAAPASSEHEAYRRKYARGTVQIGMTPESLAAEFSVAIRVTPLRVRGF